MKSTIVFLSLLALPLFAQSKVIISNCTCEIDGKKYTEATLAYTLQNSVKVKNMNFDKACEEQGSKLVIKGKDDKGKATEKTYLGKLPKVKYEKPKEIKTETLDDTVMK